MEHVELSPVDLARSGTEQGNNGTGPGARRKPRRRGIRIFLTVLILGVLYAYAVIWARWGQFNPRLGSSARAAAGIPINPTQHPWYFPILLIHVIAATIALGTCVIQAAPWVRRRYPRLHRVSGRFYIFAGVYPAAIFGLVVEVFWPFSVATAFQQAALAVLWPFVTTVGYVLKRQGRIADHRRWMMRSFALTTSVMVETALTGSIAHIFNTVRYTELGGSKYIFAQVSSATDNWLGMLIAILIVEFWLERERLRSTSPRRRLSIAAREATAEKVTGNGSASQIARQQP
jgi:uncharacterized membrane protein